MARTKSILDVRRNANLARVISIRIRERCFCCGKKNKQEIHHIRYDNSPKENLEDVVSLCVPCHRKLHAMVRSGVSLETAHIKLKMKLFKRLSDNDVERLFIEDMNINTEPERTITLKIDDFPLKLSQDIRNYCQKKNITMRDLIIKLINEGFKKIKK